MCGRRVAPYVCVIKSLVELASKIFLEQTESTTMPPPWPKLALLCLLGLRISGYSASLSLCYTMDL